MESKVNERIAERLREACVGHSWAQIEWPHRLLHEAADKIDELWSLVQAQERELAAKPKIGIYTSAIIQRRDKFLLTRHVHIGAPVWLMPGGKPEAEESAKECLIRECREELAIEIEDLEFHGAYLNAVNGREWVGLFFRIKLFTGEPVIQEPTKHSDMRWMTFAEMQEVASAQPGMGIAKYLSGNAETKLQAQEERIAESENLAQGWKTEAEQRANTIRKSLADYDALKTRLAGLLSAAKAAEQSAYKFCKALAENDNIAGIDAINEISGSAVTLRAAIAEAEAK